MRLQGVGYIKIGKALGISDNTVRSFCHRNGLGDKSKNAVACKQCGKLIKIIPKQKPKNFCSDSCRNTWWNEHRDCVNRKANYEYTCACCGRNFTAYGNNHRKYCSHACYITDRFRKGHISDEWQLQKSVGKLPCFHAPGKTNAVDGDYNPGRLHRYWYNYERKIRYIFV